MMNTWRISKALKSVRSLADVIDELTEEEVLHVLKVESDSRRRAVIIDKLILKAAELQRRRYIQILKEQYHGKK